MFLLFVVGLYLAYILCIFIGKYMKKFKKREEERLQSIRKEIQMREKEKKQQEYQSQLRIQKAEYEKRISEYAGKWRTTELYNKIIPCIMDGINESIDAVQDLITYVDTLPDSQFLQERGYSFVVSITPSIITLSTAIRMYGSHTEDWDRLQLLSAHSLFAYKQEFKLNEYKSLSNEQQEAFITAIEADMKFMVPPNTEIVRHSKYTLVFILEKHRIYKEKESLI